MYVIQITSASDKYVLGSPTIGTNNLSDDNVVYPALMMASQLGAVYSSYYTSVSIAATHCSQYMEVDVNGKKYLDWRLPTDAEIRVIYEYQGKAEASDVITEVLGGESYYNLGGGITKKDSGDEGPFVRCVRELTEDDLNYLRHLNGETVPGFNLTHYLNN